ncbi:DNA repair protein RecN [Prevotella sp. oral taxon 299]|uniref:DNA repair protein RecN n=1 Tax=Prevotella sp. oral taxon 299 TaxID=652716 RepID=UPI0001C3FDE1|nr:DNA repair protein RecN [Prevotella sp. oral taxon 299]EFC71137.1 DNA repair protein RecN [Prevotella sp. oral taxon 299 str. F0039]
MLKHLYIKNFTLIDELNIDFFSGFSVITGETGAGKSIIVGAVGLLKGNRADIKSIKANRDKCIVEATFNISAYDMKNLFDEHDIDYDENECIIRRELNNNGKSRAFINDMPVSLTTMKAIGECLIDVHSQHQNLLLNQEDFQLNIIDIIAQSQKQLALYTQAYNHYREANKQLALLKETIEKNNDNKDFMRFQLNELENMQIKDGELESIEQEVDLLGHAEEIKGALYDAYSNLSNDDSGVVNNLKTALKRVEDIVNVYPDLSDTSARMESCYIELKDIMQELGRKADNIEHDPQRLASLTERLDALNNILHKYHVTSESELLAIQADLSKQLSMIDNADEELAEMERKANELLQQCTDQAALLTQQRTKAIAEVEQKMLEKLVPLGIPNARFKVNIEAKPLSNDGCDKITFLFSANKSTDLQPVSLVASGGEIARVMLSLKALVSGAVKLPTIIFDEIDTGVSGSVAEKMAQIMYEMGQNNRQVISITHLPQIASIGSKHYKVLKEETAEGTTSTMTLLNMDERVEEIAKMLSGSNISQAAIDNAKMLLSPHDGERK